MRKLLVSKITCPKGHFQAPSELHKFRRKIDKTSNNNSNQVGNKVYSDVQSTQHNKI